MKTFHEIRIAIVVACLFVATAGVSIVAVVELTSKPIDPPAQAMPKLALAERW